MSKYRLRMQRIARYLAALTAFGIALPAVAGVNVGATRVIYDGASRDASVSLKNTDDTHPYLVQSWVENDGDAATPAPFIATPPLFRLEPSSENLLRIVHIGAPLPSDRESVFRLNVKGIPPKSNEQNVLQFAIQTRIKMFYRPKGLRGDPAQAANLLAWKLEQDASGTKLVARNDSPFHVTVSTLDVKGPGDASEEVAADLVPPLSSVSYPLTQFGQGAQPLSVVYRTINDYGGVAAPIRVNLADGRRETLPRAETPAAS